MSRDVGYRWHLRLRMAERAKRVSGAKASVAHAVPRELRPKRARIIADTKEPR